MSQGVASFSSNTRVDRIELPRIPTPTTTDLENKRDVDELRKTLTARGGLNPGIAPLLRELSNGFITVHKKLSSGLKTLSSGLKNHEETQQEFETCRTSFAASVEDSLRSATAAFPEIASVSVNNFFFGGIGA